MAHHCLARPFSPPEASIFSPKAQVQLGGQQLGLAVKVDLRRTASGDAWQLGLRTGQG